MPHIENFLGLAAVIVGFISYVPYFISIRNGETRPHAFSWFIWGLLTALAFLAQYWNGAGAGAWVTGCTALVCFTIFAAALIKGERQITRSDWLTFLTALAILPVWYFTKDALNAVILISLIDALGFYPTFRKSWNRPDQENAVTYGLSALKFFLSLLALEKFTWITSFYPISLVIMNGVFVAMILWRRKALANAPH